jgi:DNA-binding transcriptional ArsR family regulator
MGTWILAYPGVVADDLLRALAEPTHDTLLDELAAVRADTVRDPFAAQHEHGLGISRQAVSQYLAVLEAAGLVGTRREGRCTFQT